MTTHLSAVRAAFCIGLLLALSACAFLEPDLVLEPASTTLETGQTQTFQVRGEAEAVVWEASGGEIISTEGNTAVYKAPRIEASYTLIARDQGDPLRRATARITVRTEPDPVRVSVTPSLVTLQAGASQTFTAEVSGGDASRVSWRASGGEIRGGGQSITYVAPARAGTFELTVTSDEDPGEQAVATIRVTATEPGISVVAVGDIVCSPFSSLYNGGDGTNSECRMKYTAELAESLDPDAVLALGDLQYEDATLEAFQTAYEASWGRFKAITYPIPGNHEYANTQAPGYYDYFGARAGDRDKGYYSTALGSWHLVALNTNTDCAIVSCSEGSPQEQWLRDDLQTNSQTCTLAMMHHPQFSSGRRSPSEAVGDLWDALHDAGVDVVLSAHAHHYERFALQDGRGNPDPKNGTRLFISGTGGKSLYARGAVAPNSEARTFGVYGVLHLTLKEGSYDWAFIAEDGRLLDEGSEDCR